MSVTKKMNRSMKRSKINKSTPIQMKITVSNLWDAAKAVLKRSLKKKNELKKYKKYQVNNSTYHLKKWEKEM